MSNSEQAMSDTRQDFWAEEFTKMRENSGHWTNDIVVQKYIYNLIGDTDAHWLPWLFHTYFSDIPSFSRVLSVGCGDGAHEIEMFRTGKVGYIRALDASPGAVETARVRFADEGVDPARYDFDVQDGSGFHVDGKYDLAMCISAAHHIWDLDRLFLKIRDALLPDAPFVLLEYIGPNRFQWTDAQIDVVNQILAALDPAYRANGETGPLGRPDFEAMIAMDPTEAVRSEDIMPTLEKYFSVDYFRPHNGTVLHQLFPALNGDMSNKGRADFDTVVRLIILLESLLIQKNILPSDFAFIVCKAR